ncbi:hypothetical protein ACFOLF_25515 [Paenibacillus sepulcri]|uniref:Uncharacterized protein n=1 Tax=Paenibacillus sepulcri TaxID=359917 RepID=A0ABS7BYM0_9BACL|nr:hypothetical protein [Paenibacillus sepulcri]
MKLRIFLSIAMGTFLAAIILFLVDGLFIDYHQRYDGLGILSTFIFPPIGIVCAGLAYKKTGSALDMTLIGLNSIAFLSFFLMMFFGMLFFGP